MSWMNTSGDDSANDAALFGAGSSLHKTLLSHSSFFNFESFFLPKTVKELFRYSSYMFMTNDAINPAIEKLAEYPITAFTFTPIVNHNKDTKEYQEEFKSKEAIGKTWKEIFDNHLMAKGFAIKISMNFYVYGNAFVSIYQPFDRILICGNQDCKEHHLMNKVKWEWDKSKFSFKIKCWKCGIKGLAKVLDKPVKDPKRINLISWYPGNIDIDYDPYSGSREYYYNIPDDEVEKIKRGNRLRLEKTPWEIIEAIKMHRSRRDGNPKIKFRKDNIFHLVRHTIDMPGAENPWGMPITVAVLRNIFYLNIMKRAQLALMLEHILPFRYLYPGNDNTANSTIPVDLGDWRNRMQGELAKWKRDPLYIMLSPIPLGQDQMGGQGKSLMLHQEMEAERTAILNGVNVPVEFVQGGLQYTGTSVSLRMLENTLLNQTEQLVKCFKWAAHRISEISTLEYVDVSLRSFKMADDIQQRQLASSLWQMQVVSGEWLGQINDFDYLEERRKRTLENLNQSIADAKAQAEAANQMMVLQTMLQQILPPEMFATAPSIPPEQVEQVYTALKGIKDPKQQQEYIDRIGSQNPDFARELQTRAGTDTTQIAGTVQTLMSANPQQAPGVIDQMGQGSPFMTMVMETIARNFGMTAMMGSGAGGAGGAAGPPGGGKTEKPMPDQKPPNRKGGSPM
jgi:hypothetical protein